MYHLIVQLLMPFTLCLGLAWLASMIAIRKVPLSRRMRWALLLPLVGLTMASLPPVAYLAAGTLEWQYPSQGRPKGCEAIVVLGGHAMWPDAVRREPELAEDTLKRCLHAAELYHSGSRVPVIVCGGNVDSLDPGVTLAQVMGDFLVRQGVANEDLVLDQQSRDTFQNVLNTCRWARRNAIERMVVVTDATHLFRTELCFRKQGIAVQVSGCRYRATRFRMLFTSIAPNPYAAASVQEVAHEWVGIAWYWVRGRV